MKKEDIFIGPIIRRAADDLIVIQLATFTEFKLRFSCRAKYTTDWIWNDNSPQIVKALPNLFFYYGRIKPAKTKRFPMGKLLEYSIAVTDADGKNPDYSKFEKIAEEEYLTYNKHVLPSFFIQSPSQKLRVLYGSCRQIHDDKGGKIDALRIGDEILNTTVDDLSRRPAVLCLMGDQIYADDVQEDVFQECINLGKKISSQEEERIPGVSVPSSGNRGLYVRREARFTSTEADNHLVRFSDYLAMYGLSWNKRNWSKDYPNLAHFTISLPKIRRLLANIPTYMIFDDHDVTDDWNISVKWMTEVYNSLTGRRIVSNALAAFWLCQGYGNDPRLYDDEKFKKACILITKKGTFEKEFDSAFWKPQDLKVFGNWEFATPTFPFIYFLDTRTNRSYKDQKKRDENAPAYLKSLNSWKTTIEEISKLVKTQRPHYPLILVAPSPIFGISTIENLQKLYSETLKDPYHYDYESWSANAEHLVTFLRSMGDKNAVILSGDVHYSFTSTAEFTVFDDSLTSQFSGKILPFEGARGFPMKDSYQALYHSRFIQLNSSAFKNFAKDVLQALAMFNLVLFGMFLTEDNRWVRGAFKDGEVFEFKDPRSRYETGTLVKTTKEKMKPSCFLKQNSNDSFNSSYISDHNIGLLTVSETEVTNCFFTPSGKQSERTWNFSNDHYWA